MPILKLSAGQSAIWRILRTIADAVFQREHPSAGQPSPEEDGPRRRGDVNAERTPGKTIERRLTEELASLEQLNAERKRRGDSHFGKTSEDRIVWGELIELELQEIDEEVTRLYGAAGHSSKPPGTSNLRKGGPHEPHDS